MSDDDSYNAFIVLAAREASPNVGTVASVGNLAKSGRIARASGCGTGAAAGARGVARHGPQINAEAFVRQLLKLGSRDKVGVARWAPDDATDRAPSRDFRDFRRRAGVARTGSEWRDALKQQRLIGAAPIVPLATRPRQHERSSYSYLLGTMLKVSEREDMLLPPPVRGIVSSRMQLSPAYTLRDYTELE